MSVHLRCLAGWILLGLAAACSDRPTASPSTTRTKPLVCTPLYPLYYFAERLAGEQVELACLVQSHQDPLHWQPDEAAIQRLQSADLILLNGAGAEPWTFAVSLPQSRVELTALSFADRWRKIAHAVTHSHGQGEVHTHEGADPFTWMDPQQAKAQAEAVGQALRKLLPNQQAQLDERARALAADLDDLDRDLAAIEPAADEVLVAAAPIYDYPAARHGWRIVNLDIDPTKTAGPEVLTAAKAKLAGQRARVILWPSEPLPALATQVRETLGLEGVVWSAGQSLPSAGAQDWIAAMRSSAGRLRTALARQ